MKGEVAKNNVGTKNFPGRGVKPSRHQSSPKHNLWVFTNSQAQIGFRVKAEGLRRHVRDAEEIDVLPHFFQSHNAIRGFARSILSNSGLQIAIKQNVGSPGSV